MKKLRILLGLIFITIVLMSINVNSALLLNDSNELINAYKNDSLVRLHVIANSNSPLDQYIKRNVRNQLLAYMGKYADKDKNELYEDINKIEDFINTTLKKEGIDYEANGKFGEYFFPDRTYQELTLPAGRYKALKVELGKGRGANWWCVLLPPMCIEDQKNVNTLSKQIEFRFKILDWFNKKEESDITVADSKKKLTIHPDTHLENKYINKMTSEDEVKSLTYKMQIDKSIFYTIVNSNKNNSKNINIHNNKTQFNTNINTKANAFYGNSIGLFQDKDYKLKDIIKLSLH